MHIADRSLYLAISRLLWAFDFSKAINPVTGEEITPDMDNLAEGVMMLPNPFAAKITPRTPQRAEAVRREWAEVAKLLDTEEQWSEVPEGLIWNDEQNVE
jgi:hypothetical protein